MVKQITIIGGGISSIFASIRIKELHPDYEVSVFEHNDKLLKKIYATGNGKCNYANTGSVQNKYNHEEFVLPIYERYNASFMIDYLSKLGITPRYNDDLVYPYSESAETVANSLLKKVKELNIKVHLSTDVIGYDKSKIYTNNGDFPYDILIISCGGKSSSHLGSSGELWDILKEHGYKLIDANPSLCPIKTKENTKMVEGIRSKGKVSLYHNNKLIHQENGEVLFKKDGISGICIFNLAHYINMLDDKKNVTIHIDFAPNVNDDISSLVHPKLAKYLLNNNLDIHNTTFTFKSFYDFSFSQVTSGGISLDDLNPNLESKKEKNVYFIGEIVDIDAICGGFNIMWAFMSAHLVSNNI